MECLAAYVCDGKGEGELPCGCIGKWSFWFHRSVVCECLTCGATWQRRQGVKQSEKQRLRDALETVVRRLDRFYGGSDDAGAGFVSRNPNYLPTIWQLAKDALGGQ